MKDRRTKRIQQSLTELPTDLFKTYSRIIGSLENSGEQSLAARILMFVCYSARPVTLAEVAEFAILEDGMTSIDPQDRLEDFAAIIAPLSSLLDIRGDVLALSHKSVQEYLVAGHRRGLLQVFAGSEDLFDANGGADLYIALRCVQYLNIEQKPVRDLDRPADASRPNARHLSELHGQYPLLEYAATRWAHHARRKEAQLLLYQRLNETLPVITHTNLWKAWIMLQPADIWENQLALCRVVAEASIRGWACPAWSVGFWKERHLYRISNQAHEDKPPLSPRQMTEKSGPPAENALLPGSGETTLSTKARDIYLAKALRDCNTPRRLQFSKDDIMTLHLTETQSEWWGKTRAGSGFVDPADVEISSRPIPHVMGIPFYHLAIALLEIAHQSPLHTTELEPIESITSEVDFAAHFTTLDKFVRQAGSIMGNRYEVIVGECLKSVVYASEYLMIDMCSKVQGLIANSDWHMRFIPESALTLFMNQDQAMKDIYAPLQAMVKSGFRASRQIFVPHRLQQQLRISRQFATGSLTGQEVPVGDKQSGPVRSPDTAASKWISSEGYGRWSSQTTRVNPYSPDIYGGRWSAQTLQVLGGDKVRFNRLCESRRTRG